MMDRAEFGRRNKRALPLAAHVRKLRSKVEFQVTVTCTRVLNYEMSCKVLVG
jgi:hypothetical protein